VIEGMVIAGYAMGATAGYNYIHGEVWALRAVRGGAGGSARRGVRRAEHPRSGYSFELYAHPGYGAYICGEETALLDSLEAR